MVIPRLQQRPFTWPRPALDSDFWFGQVNSRPLSLFRVGIALVILRDALLHIPIAAAFYSDSGLTPRAAVAALLTDQPLRFSLLHGIGSPWLATLFFLGWAGVACCLLVGYKARFAAALNFICVLSVYWRNPFITSGADDILRVVSFWMLFIPLNHHFSLDTRHHHHPNRMTYAFPVRLLQVQIALIYLGAGLSKLLGGQWTDGTALFYVLQLESLLRPLGHWLSAVAPLWVLQGLTYGVLLLEISFPILVFAPIKQPTLRILALLAMGLMHLGIALVMTMPLWDFVLVLGVSYLLFAAQTATPTEPVSVAKSIPQRALTLSLAGLMGLVIWQNGDGFRVLDVPLMPKLPVAAAHLLDLTGLRQNWGLFAPQPYQSDWTLIVPGTFTDGTQFDLRTGDLVPETINPLPPGTPYRWKRFEQVLALQRPASFLNAWADSYCQQHQGYLAQVQIRVLYRASHPPDAPPHLLQNELIWLQVCQ
jgi:hypothetical protein